MKKLKIIVAAILRGVILLTPGAVFLVWAWTKVPALFSILASVGVETLFLFLFSFITVAVQAAKDMNKKQTDQSA